MATNETWNARLHEGRERFDFLFERLRPARNLLAHIVALYDELDTSRGEGGERKMQQGTRTIQ